MNMNDFLYSLYEKSLSQDQKLITEATEVLTDLYKNSETINHLINLIQIPDQRIKRAALIGLQATIRNVNVGEYIESKALNFPELFIHLIKNEESSVIRKMILTTFETFLSFYCESNEILEFIKSLTVDTNESKLELYFVIFDVILQYLPIDKIAKEFNLLCEQANCALNMESSGVVIACSHFISNLLSTISTLPTTVHHFYNSMMNILVNAMLNNDKNTTNYLKDISNLISNVDQFEQTSTLLDQYISIILNTSISIEYRVLISDLICNLIEKYPIDCINDMHKIIEISMLLGYQSVIDDCFEQENDVMYALRPLEFLCQASLDPDNYCPDKFYSTFWECVSADTPQTIIVTSMAISNFIEYIPDLISDFFSDLFDYSIQCVNHENHCVKESGFSILYQLISRNSQSFLEFFDQVINVTIASLQIDHEPLIYSALSFITELLYLVEVEDKYIEPFISILSSLSQTAPISLHHLIITAISAISISASESITAFIQPVFPFLARSISADVNTYPLIKARAIEAISYLIRFAPNETTELHQTMFDIIHECIQYDDLSLFSSCMISIKNLVLSSVFKIDPNLLFTSIIKILQIDLSTNDNKDTQNAIIEGKQTALDLVNTIVKTQENIIIPYIQIIATLAVNHYESQESSLQESSLNASISIIKAFGQNENYINSNIIKELILKMLENLNSSDEMIISLVFIGFSKLIKYHLIQDDEILNKITKSGLRFLKYDDQSNFEVVSNEIFGFFASYAQYLPEKFPIEKFSTITTKLRNEQEIETYVEYLSIIIEYYAVAHQNIQFIFAKTFIAYFFEGLQFCNAEIPPHPIAGVCCYIDITQNISENEQEKVIEYLSNILNLEFDEQPYYWETISCSISLLFSLSRRKGVSNFIEFFSKALQLLPKALTKAESENILSSLLIFSQNESFFNQFQSEILRIFTIVFSYKAYKFKKLKLQAHTVKSIASLLLSSLSNEFIHSLLTEIEIRILQNRLSTSQ